MSKCHRKILTLKALAGGGEGSFQKFNVQYVKIFIQDVTQKS